MHAYQALLFTLAATATAQSLCAPTLAAKVAPAAAPAAPRITAPAALPSAWSEWKNAATVQSPQNGAHADADATVQGPIVLHHGAEATVQGPRLHKHHHADATVQSPVRDAEATVQGPFQHAAAATVQTQQRAADATVQGPRMAVMTKRSSSSSSSTAFVRRDAIFATKQQQHIPSITISVERSGATAVGSAREAGATVQGPREELAARPTAAAAAAWFLAAAS